MLQQQSATDIQRVKPRSKMEHLRMESHTNFGQEDLEILAAEILFCRVPDFFQRLAARNTWLRVYSCERKVVIARFEVTLLLL